MLEIIEYLHEKLDWAADRIAELLTGSRVYRVREVKARGPDVRRIADARQAKRLQPPVLPCDRH
ncbi:MAG: hypothetical protein ABSH41_07580 [Syntrophobacteraceae bacterium]|jgi:hypothetical protein